MVVTCTVSIGICVGAGARTSVVSSALDCIARCQCVAAVVSDGRQRGRFGCLCNTSHCRALVCWHVKVLRRYCVGVNPVMVVVCTVGVGECVGASSRTAVIGATLNCCARCQCVAAVVGDCRCVGFGCIRNAGNCCSVVGRHVKILRRYCVGVNPVMTVACTVGECILVNDIAFARWCCCRITALKSAGQCVATSIGNIRQSRCCDFRCTSYCPTAICWHCEIVALNCVGVSPVVSVAFAVGECILVHDIAFARWCCCRVAALKRSCQCNATCIGNDWQSRCGNFRCTGYCQTAVCRHREVISLYRICKSPCLCMTCTIRIGIYVCCSTFTCDTTQIRGCCQCCRRRYVSSASIGNCRHNTRA